MVCHFYRPLIFMIDFCEKIFHEFLKSLCNILLPFRAIAEPETSIPVVFKNTFLGKPEMTWI